MNVILIAFRTTYRGPNRKKEWKFSKNQILLIMTPHSIKVVSL